MYGQPFVWNPEHSGSFKAIEREFTSVPILKYHDLRKSPTLHITACLESLGAFILQEHTQSTCQQDFPATPKKAYVAIELE